MSPAEQAHMNRIIERKQVRLRPVTEVAPDTDSSVSDARLHADVLQPR